MAFAVNFPATSRRINSLKLRGRTTGSRRSEHVEENIPLDLERDPNDNLKEILTNVCAQYSVSTGRKLGHLNNLVKLLCSLSDASLIEIPMHVIMTCLKVTIVSEVKEVRAAGVRALRYLINDSEAKKTFTDLSLDYLVTKCLDISHFNEVERIHAIRLVRKLAHMKRRRVNNSTDPIVPLSLVACIVSMSLGGAEERDRVYRTCLAVLCELALLQPWLVVRCNGVLVLINAILECHMYQRINECLCLSLMHIINHPSLSEWHEPILDVSPTFAPYTELNYRFHSEVDDSKLKEELEMRFVASRMAIVSLLRTWTGLLHIFHAKDMISSFVQSLLIPNENVRRGIMLVLCDIFYFNELLWTDSFNKALNAAAPGHFKDNWRIAEGFVVAEAKDLLPVRSVSRPDLVDCHLAIVLSYFLQAGLLEALTKVAISTDTNASVSATIILGSVLHLASHLLPDVAGQPWVWHLPDLLTNASSETSMEERVRINLTVKRLEEVYMMRNRPPSPYSLYLTQLKTQAPHHYYSSNSSAAKGRSNTASSSDGSTSVSFSILKRNRSLNLIRDFTEDPNLPALKNTKVLLSKENKEWDWDALQSLLTSAPSVAYLRAVGTDDTVRRFYRRLIYFYLPSSKLFSSLPLCKEGMSDENRKYVLTACYMVRCLSRSDEEGKRLLKNLITDIVDSLPKVNSEASTYSKAAGSLAVTCSREYFLILGTLSYHPRGDELLGHCKAYHYFMGLASKESHEAIVRLMVSSLHYSEDSPARAVLSKVLTTCNEASRLYATGFLRVLLRANCPGFKRWGTELLTTQLFDESNEVASEALDILHEACDNRKYLRAVIRLRPTLLHLGERGAILVCRFLSEPLGFIYLSQNHYLSRELERWWSEYNERYVLHVEELLKLSLTTFEKASKEDDFVRRSGNRKSRKSVYLPAHLYGELCGHEAGARLVEEENIAFLLTEKLKQLISDSEVGSHRRKHTLSDDDEHIILKMKSCIWALMHIGSTVHGLPLLKRCSTLPIITRLANESPSSSVRGSCVYGLCAIAQTIPGVEALQKLGYKSVLRTVNKSSYEDEEEPYAPPEPIVTPRTIRGDLTIKSISSSSQWSTASTSSPSNRSPPGSISNLSITSETAASVFSPERSRLGRSKKSRRSSRGAVSDPESSFNRKNRILVKKKAISVTDDKSGSISPDAISASTVSLRSSIFDGDTSSYKSSSLSAKHSHSLKQKDHANYSTNSNHVKVKKHANTLHVIRDGKSDLSAGDAVPAYSGPRVKFHRFIDSLWKKNRTKSLAGSERLTVSKQPTAGTHHDDASSGYASGQLTPLNPSSFQRKTNYFNSHETQFISRQPHPSLTSDSTAKSSSSSPTRCIKIVESKTVKSPPPVVSAHKQPEERACIDNKNISVQEKTNVAKWNTNNSGQTNSTVSNSIERVRTRSQFYAVADRSDLLHEGGSECSSHWRGVRRAHSLPDLLDNGDVTMNTASFNSLSNKLDRHTETVHYVSTNQSNEEILTNNLNNSTSIPEVITPDAGPVLHPISSVRHDGATNNDRSEKEQTLVVRPSLPQVIRKAEQSLTASYTARKADRMEVSDVDAIIQPCRPRGNTQVSQDSGVVLSSSTPAASTNSPLLCSGEVVPSVVASGGESEWKISRPQGLAAVRLFKENAFRGSAIDRTSCDIPAIQVEVLSSEEKADILRTTRYVGITVPDVLRDLFRPSKESMSKKKCSLKPSMYLRDGFKCDGIIDTGDTTRERKISSVRQPPKFRGLDDSTSGTARSVGWKQHKPFKIQSVVTPFARTPDSLLSEVGDMCYVGGHMIELNSHEFISLLHEEIIQLVINLASSVGVKAHETSLLMMKEKRPEVFDSLSLYNSIVKIMSEYSFRLTARRFVQELFQDVRFTEVYQEAQRALQSIS